MDKFIVFLIIALAVGYVVRRFFFNRGCGCGCSSGCPGADKKGVCCPDERKPL